MFSFRNHKRKVKKTVTLVASGFDTANRNNYTWSSISSGDPAGPCTAHVAFYGGDANTTRDTTNGSTYNSVSTLEEYDMGTIRTSMKMGLFNVDSTSATLYLGFGGQHRCNGYFFYRIDGLLDRKKFQGQDDEQAGAGSDTTAWTGFVGKFDASKMVLACYINSTSSPDYSEGGLGSETASPDKNWATPDEQLNSDAELYGTYADLGNIDTGMTDAAYMKATAASQRNRGQIGVLM